MKEKTSITLSEEIISRLDRMAGSKHSRSAVIEWILRQYFRRRDRERAQARDLELLNQAADQLNAEVDDILEYQSWED